MTLFGSWLTSNATSSFRFSAERNAPGVICSMNRLPSFVEISAGRLYRAAIPARRIGPAPCEVLLTVRTGDFHVRLAVVLCETELPNDTFRQARIRRVRLQCKGSLFGAKFL